MSEADTHIRIARETKERLRRRKRADESFNDVIERNLDDNRNFRAGFGAATDRSGETLAETVARRKERSNRRIEQFAKDESDDCEDTDA